MPSDPSDRRFSETEERLDRMSQGLREPMGGQVPMSSRILSARQDARRALPRIGELLEERAAGGGRPDA